MEGVATIREETGKLEEERAAKKPVDALPGNKIDEWKSTTFFFEIGRAHV